MVAPHLQEKTKHPVESHLQRGNAGAFDLLRLVTRDPGLATGGQFGEMVESGIAAGTDESAIAGKDGAALPQHRADPQGDVGAGIELLAQIGQQTRRPLEAGHHRRQDRRGVADPLQIPRARPARHHSPGQPLQVADAGELLNQRGGEPSVGDQARDGIEPGVDRGLVDQGGRDPVNQQPGSHRRFCTIEHACQRAGPPVDAGGSGAPNEIEAAPGGFVDLHALAAPPGGERLDPAHGRRLILLEIGNDRAGREDARLLGRKIEPQPLQPAPGERPAHCGEGGRFGKPPVGAGGERALAPRGPEQAGHRLPILLGAEAFGWLQPQNHFAHIFCRQYRRLKPASSHIDPGQAHQHAS